MEIVFYVTKQNKCPVKKFIEKLNPKDRAHVLACLRNIEELGFDSPRVGFRHMKGEMWEIKIKSTNASFRIFYINIIRTTLVLLHAYKKQSQKAPKKELKIAESRLVEVIQHEKNYA